MVVAYTGVHANEEGVIHNHVGVIKVAHNTMGDVMIRRVAKKVAAEEVACLDAVCLQESSQVVSGKTSVFSYGYNVAEPGWI